MVVEVEEAPQKWAFVCLSLGDCKAFHWSAKTKEVVEITEGNRQNVTDAKGTIVQMKPCLLHA
jgi:hypothetical protein